MNELVCRNDDCENVVMSDEEDTAVSCSYCNVKLGVCHD